MTPDTLNTLLKQCPFFAEDTTTVVPFVEAVSLFEEW